MRKNISNALDYITSYNIPEVVKSYDYLDEECTVIGRDYYTIYPVAFSLHAFSYMPENKRSKELLNWIANGVKFLQSEGEVSWSFNFAIREFNASGNPLAVPDDLDDTALVLSTFGRLGVDFSENYLLNLLNIESKEGGPYKTWYVSRDPENTWSDIDPVVNAHLLYMLSTLDIDLPNTRNYVLESFREGNIFSKYYLSGFFFLFYLSKYASEVKNQEIKQDLLQKVREYNFNNLTLIEQLLYLLILSHLGTKLNVKQLNWLTSLQGKKGNLPASVICKGIPVDGAKSYSGCEVFSTALFLETLLLQLRLKDSETKKQLSEGQKKLKKS